MIRLNEIFVIDDYSSLTNLEKKLSKFFKCCMFAQNCFATFDDHSLFLQHLHTKHFKELLFCIYCWFQDSTKEHFISITELIEHLLYEHSYRLYQCNSCLYRAISKYHVDFHQANFHTKKYIATQKGLNLCKIIKCQPVISGPLIHDRIFFFNFEKNGIRNPIDYYRCLYCSFQSNEKHLVFIHISQSHLDFNPCILDTIVDTSEINNSTIKNKYYEDIELSSDIVPLNHYLQSDSPAEISQELENDLPIEINQNSNLSQDSDEIFFEKLYVHNVSNVQNHNESDNLSEEIFPQLSPEIFDDNESQITESSPIQVSNKQSEIESSKPVKETEPLNKTHGENKIAYKNKSKFDLSKLVTLKKTLKKDNKSNKQFFTPLPLVNLSQNLSARNLFECLICGDKSIRQQDISSHVKKIHGCDSSLKCARCIFVGTKNNIISHFSIKHPGTSANINKLTKFIISVKESNAASFNAKKVIKTPRIVESNKKDQSHKTNKTKDILNLSKVDLEIMSTDKITPKKLTPSSLKPKQVCRKSISGVLRKKTSIERESSIFFCLFCDNVMTDWSESISHFKKHLQIKRQCLYCQEENSSIALLRSHCAEVHIGQDFALKSNTYIEHINWIISFLNDQFLSIKTLKNSSSVFAQCPICIKAGAIKNVKTKLFTSWSEFTEHYWNHGKCGPLRCNICRKMVFLHKKKAHWFENHQFIDPKYLFDNSINDIAESYLINIYEKCEMEFNEKLKRYYGIRECSIVLERICNIKVEPLD